MFVRLNYSCEEKCHLNEPLINIIKILQESILSGKVLFLKGLIKADSPSMPTPSTQTTVWSQQARKERNNGNHMWTTNDVSTTVMKKQTFLLTSNEINSRENINTLKTTSINQIIRQRNEGKKP